MHGYVDIYCTTLLHNILHGGSKFKVGEPPLVLYESGGGGGGGGGGGAAPFPPPMFSQLDKLRCPPLIYFFLAKTIAIAAYTRSPAAYEA